MKLPADDAKPPKSRDQQYDEFVVLLSRHEQSLRRFVRSLLLSPDGVDDVVQETALECWKKFDEFQPADHKSSSDEFIRWSCVIARFKVLSWQRDRSRERLVFRESVICLLAEDAIASQAERDYERRAVEACLEELTEDQRRLVLSVHSPGESVANIAAETGVKARRLYSKVNMLRTLLLRCVQHRILREASHG